MAAYRDMSVPYTVDEVAGLRELFRSMNSYKDGVVNFSEDCANLLKGMRYERTPEQIQFYVDFWEQNFGKQKYTEDLFITFATSLYNSSLYAREVAIRFDEDKNGYISAEEFAGILALLSIHDPSISGKGYDEFVEEADTNHDGKVDIEECTKWIEDHYKK